MFFKIFKRLSLSLILLFLLICNSQGALNTIENKNQISAYADDDILFVTQGGIVKRGSAELIRDYAQKSTTIVPVFSTDDLPEAVGGVITLGTSTTYRFHNPITLSDTLLMGANTRITDLGVGNNIITSSADPIFSFQGSTGNSLLERVTVVGDGTNTLFGGTASAGSGLGFSFSVFSNIATIGTTTNMTLVPTRSSIIGFSTGWTMDGGGLLAADVFVLMADPTADNVDIITLTDSAWTSGRISMNSLVASSKANGNLFNINSGLTANMFISDTDYSGGGNLFKSGGLDEKSVNVRSQGNPGFKDSSIVGACSIHNNAVETTITTLNAWTSIGAGVTCSAFTDNERISYSDHIFTITSRDPFLSKIHVNGVIKPASGLPSYEFGVFINDVFFGDIDVSPDASTAKGSSFGGVFVTTLDLDDTVEVKVRNTSNTTNAVIEHLDPAIVN